MPKPRLCIDVDNVIAQTDVVMRQVINAYTNGRVDLQYEDVGDFDYHKCVDANGQRITKKDWVRVHQLFSTPRYLWSIEPFDGVQVHLTRLLGKFDLHVATSRLAAGRIITVQWLEYHGFPKHDLHFVQHGEKHSTLGRFHAAVEDHYQQAAGFADLGTTCYLIRHPWNDGKPALESITWVDDWNELAAILLR